MACSYANRLGLTAWRRKTTVLLAIILLMILGFGLQYSRTETENEGISNIVQQTLIMHKEKEPSLLKRSENVKFVNKKLDLKDMHATKDPNLNTKPFLFDTAAIANLEQPSRDEIAARRMTARDEFLEQQRVDADFDQLGIPYTNIDSKKPYVPPQRLIHFDLKGAPPKISYLKRIMPLLKTLGATGILLEYEDMFPFTGNIKDLAAKNAYTKKSVMEILQAANESKLEVIPLVQTFGHMEFALKHEKFIGIREVPDSPQALCPSRNQSLDLVREIITQVMDMHRDIRYLHVGCDEVFQMGECEKCRGVMREVLFLQHVKHVVDIVKRQWPNVKIIIWDDMLRHISQQTLEEMAIGKLVQPMVWVYAEDIYRFVQSQVWEKYAAVFPTVWAASAFKGAFGETLYVPNAKRHLENNLRWLEVMSQQSPGFKDGFEGIVITGWQRYDHFAVLCELLPAALPSLAISLLATSNGYFNGSMRAPLLSALSCPQYTSSSHSSPFVTLETDPYLWDKFSRCLFPGSPFFKLTYRLHSAETEANEYIDSVLKHKGWMTDYNVRHNYSLPLRVDELTSDFSRVYHTMCSLARSTSDSMNDVFDAYTINEWIEQRIYPYIKTLEKIQIDSIALKARRTWPKRPLEPLKDLQRLGVPTPQVVSSGYYLHFRGFLKRNLPNEDTMQYWRHASVHVVHVTIECRDGRLFDLVQLI